MTARVGAIVGPTGVGKSTIAVEVAEALGAEIVSVDSMQVYTGMDIGTDKATAEMRSRVPHHLLDQWLPSHNLAVSEFQAEARNAGRAHHEARCASHFGRRLGPVLPSRCRRPQFSTPLERGAGHARGGG